MNQTVQQNTMSEAVLRSGSLSKTMSSIECSWCFESANWVLTSLSPVKCGKCNSVIPDEDTLYLCDEKCEHFCETTTLEDTLDDGQKVEITDCPDCDFDECDGCASLQFYAVRRLNNQDLFCLHP